MNIQKQTAVKHSKRNFIHWSFDYGKIVAIGGGENGHHNTKYETAPFDKEIIRLTGKQNPNFLFIGLANNYPDYYFEVMDGIYNGIYGCKTDYLRYEEIKNNEISSNKIKKAI